MSKENIHSVVTETKRKKKRKKDKEREKKENTEEQRSDIENMVRKNNIV